jgi:BlaI family penicillinase repressor
LWEKSPLPVRDVRARLEADAGRPLAHSSVITMLNIMHRKGFLRRRKDGKTILFSPKELKENVSGGIVGDVLSRMFDGDPSAMVMNLIDTADFDVGELDELRKLIARKAKERDR